MQNQIQVFSNENFGSVRVLGDSQNPLFCASDVCKVLGHSNGAVIVGRLFGEGITKCYTPTNGGIQELTYLTEPQLYKLIMRSNAKNAEQFQDWVCGEVLPSIRKNGSYSINQQYRLPKTYKEALLELVRAEEEKELLLLQAKENEPKIQCFNELMDSKNAISFANFSKIIGIGEIKLFAMCREAGILMSNNKPYQKHIDAEHFRVIEKTFNKGNCKTSYSQTLITPKGQAYLTKKFKGESK